MNPLLKDWPGRTEFVDDTTALEIIPRCSPSLLSMVVNDIYDFSSKRGMKLNPKKCKEMVIKFLNIALHAKTEFMSQAVWWIVYHVLNFSVYGYQMICHGMFMLTKF